jgi:hypothetical protein
MIVDVSRKTLRELFERLIAVSLAALAGVGALSAQGSAYFVPDNLVVSRSVYNNNAGNVTVGAPLPPNCAVPASCVLATYNGTYPSVWNNVLADASFGITSPIFLDQISPSGTRLSSLQVPNSSQNGITSASDQLVTSFSSKSEIALNLSSDHLYLTFMGYVAPVNAIDISNSNTPGVVDPTNPVGENAYRAVAQVDENANFHFTLTNAYSGNNGRAAILNNAGGANVIYTSGNAGNGGNPQPNGIIAGAGAQILTPSVAPESQQTPGTPTPVGSFNITQLGLPADKIGKDTNFRGLTIFNNVLYYTKGSGSNGVNTVYFVDTTGTVCTDTKGVGLPAVSASLPTSPLAYNSAVLQTKGVDPNNMCILSGFPTALKSTTSFPFGVWFADPNTLYVTDEGNGDTTYSSASDIYTKAGAQTTAGLQKWIFTSGVWKLAYTLQAGLNLGVPYTVANYPTGNNGATGLPWPPATDGLRNLTGTVNWNHTATIYAVTSTVSGNGDQGADPNNLVAITDNIGAATLPPSESFATVYRAGFGEVLRGVSFTPGTGTVAMAVNVNTDYGTSTAPPNTFNIDSEGALHVAILGSPTFNVTTIDPSTVKFGPNGASNVGQPFLEDVNADGIPDLVLSFVPKAAGFGCSDTVAVLSGQTLGKQPFFATQTVQTTHTLPYPLGVCQP